MDTQSKKELEKLYGLAKSATATTHFYNQVYKYIGYINQSSFLMQILDEDEKEMQIHDREKYKTLPQQQEDESDHTYFLKRMRHMNSGEHFFTSHLFFLLNHNIFDILDWHYTDNLPTEEAIVMLNGKKKISIIDKLEKRFNRQDMIRHSSEDYNEKYITDFPIWKNILINFHTKLLKKIEETKLKTTPEEKGEIVLRLYTNGDFTYLKNKGNLNPKNKEYKLLYVLIKSNKYTVSYIDIANKIFRNIELASKPREEIRQLVKRLKRELGITSTTRHKLIESITNTGYHLVFQGDERAIIVP